MIRDEPRNVDGVTPTSSNQEQMLRLYKRRWFVLFVGGLLNASNAFSWIAYAPVANFVDEFYGAHASNWLSLVFLISAVPVGFLAMWSTGKFGLRSAILTASWLNAIGSIIRLFSSIPGFTQPIKFAVVLFGQCIAAFAYPFIMFLPTKIAASWFPNDQRTLANSIVSLSNPVGVLIANMISPRLVVETCAAEQSMTFLKGMKKVAKSRAYMTLLICLGGGIGIFNTLYTVMQQILCARGYHNEFAGMCCMLMIVSGVVGATVSSYIVDPVISGVLFTFTSRLNNSPIAIAFSCVLFGTFGLAAYPVGLELGAECTFPVAESTSSGLIVLSGQLQSVVFISVVQMLSVPLHGVALQHQVCTIKTAATSSSAVSAFDMTTPLLTLCGVATFSACIFIIFFKPKLRRVVLERGLASSVNASKRAIHHKEGIIEVKTIVASPKLKG
ncbi:unnamed protein product [Soboliphyme baturini]|uniref:MFS domain-containing protein n=1 Tax=Soboliphyme baturini TaxID=241478 RepID=A0A183JAK3_9BILA|nr:unnamed protein product [Soboliphyme baturini]